MREQSVEVGDGKQPAICIGSENAKVGSGMRSTGSIGLIRVGGGGGGLRKRLLNYDASQNRELACKIA
jgi:hypothetical protein